MIFSKVIIHFTKMLKRVIFNSLLLFTHKKNTYVAFSGWVGELFIDNSKYLALYFDKMNNKNIKLFWFGNEKIQEEVCSSLLHFEFINRRSIRAFFIALKCKIFICCQSPESDFLGFNSFWKSTVINLWHGVPLKRMNFTSPFYKKSSLFFTIIHHIENLPVPIDKIVVSSRLNENVFTDDFHYDRQKFIQSGYPRNDYLLNNKFNKLLLFELKTKYSKVFGFDVSKKIVLYAPTFRKTKNNSNSIDYLDEETRICIKNLLTANNSILIEKNHFATSCNKTGKTNSWYFHTNNEKVDFQELLLISDYLISDYSGAILDFVLLDRQQIVFASDYFTYKKNDSGLHFDIFDYAPGEVAFNSVELLNSLNNLFEKKDLFKNKREYVRKKYMTYETGNSCKQLYDYIIGITNGN